jgi:plasmid stabilization system protein ParE
MKILITKSAFSDFEAIKEYYLEEGVPHIGNEFVVAIIEHIQTLEQHPDIGRPVPEFNTPKIRELVHAPFRVVYLREISSIHVVRVWRSERILVLPDEKT